MTTDIQNFFRSIEAQPLADSKDVVVESNLYLPKGSSVKVYTEYARIKTESVQGRDIYKIYFRTLDDKILLLTGSQFLFSRGPLGRLGVPKPFDLFGLPLHMQISRNKDGKFFFFPVEEK